MREIDKLFITYETLLKLAKLWGIASPEAANLTESRRLVASELRDKGWELADE